MITYESEEELNRLKVLTMVLRKEDFERLANVALNVLQINPNNPIATMFYKLDIKRVYAVNDIFKAAAKNLYWFYSFKADIANNYLKEFAKSEIITDKDSREINLQILSSLIHFFAFSTYSTENTLNLIFECLNKLQSSKETRTAFYKTTVENFCDDQSLRILKYLDTHPSSSSLNVLNLDILEERKLCLLFLKKRIFDDNEIAEDTKNSLINKLSGTSCINIKKWIFRGFCIIPVILFIAMFVSCLKFCF